MDAKEYRDRFERGIAMSLLDPIDAEECLENVECITKLAWRGIITPRLADHLIDTMATRKAEQWRAKHPEFRAGVGHG